MSAPLAEDKTADVIRVERPLRRPRYWFAYGADQSRVNIKLDVARVAQARGQDRATAAESLSSFETKALHMQGFRQSGRRDSNSGPLVPQTSALTRLRHAPWPGHRSGQRTSRTAARTRVPEFLKVATHRRLQPEGQHVCARRIEVPPAPARASSRPGARRATGQWIWPGATGWSPLGGRQTVGVSRSRRFGRMP